MSGHLRGSVDGPSSHGSSALRPLGDRCRLGDHRRDRHGPDHGQPRAVTGLVGDHRDRHRPAAHRAAPAAHELAAATGVASGPGGDADHVRLPHRPRRRLLADRLPDRLGRPGSRRRGLRWSRQRPGLAQERALRDQWRPGPSWIEQGREWLQSNWTSLAGVLSAGSALSTVGSSSSSPWSAPTSSWPRGAGCGCGSSDCPRPTQQPVHDRCVAGGSPSWPTRARRSSWQPSTPSGSAWEPCCSASRSSCRSPC